MKKDDILHIYNNCILTKGVLRGSIVDLYRKRIEFIPNELIDLLEKYNGLKIDLIYNETDQMYHDILEEYFNFLLKHEFIYLSQTKEPFLPLNTDFESPKKILSSIIDLNSNSTYNIKLAIKKIVDLNCHNLQIRFYHHDISLQLLDNILSYTNNTVLRNIELLLPYNSKQINSFKQLISKYNRVYTVIFHSYDKKDTVEESELHQFIYTSNKIDSCSFCGYISPFYFDFTHYAYLIGENYNSCLYKKIAVDINGYIKNCPSLDENFGHIDEFIELNTIINLPAFQKYWNITKEKIEVCKTCEFRKICTDCRAYIHNSHYIYSKPKKCSYEPSQANW